MPVVGIGGGGSESPCAALFCAVLCRAAYGGGGQRGLVPCRAKCSYATRSFVEAHMY